MACNSRGVQGRSVTEASLSFEAAAIDTFKKQGEGGGGAGGGAGGGLGWEGSKQGWTKNACFKPWGETRRTSLHSQTTP